MLKRLGFSCTLAIATAPCAQAELLLTPTFTPSVYVDDNRRLQPVDGSGLVASVTRVGVESVYRRPTYSLEVTPEFRLTRNSSQKELDAEDYFLDVNGQKMLERHQFGLGFGFTRQLSATTELLEGGQINAAIPKTQYDLSGNWTYFVSSQLSFTTYGNHTDVSYEDAATSNLVDYNYSIAGINVDYAFSAQTSLLGRSSVSIFETPSLMSETTSYTFQFGFRHAFDPTLDAEFLVGQNIGRSKFSVIQNAIVSFVPLRFAPQRVTSVSRGGGQVLNTSINKTFDDERAKFGLDWNRAFSPSSFGSRQKQQSITARYVYRLSYAMTARLRFVYNEREQETTTGVSLRPIKQYTVGGILSYRWSPQITTSLDYRFSLFERVNTGVTSDSNRVTVKLEYRGEPITDLASRLGWH